MQTQKPRVLLIEDDSSLRELNTLILREAGYQVETLPTNAEPVAVAARTHPDAIVVHIRYNKPEDWQIIDRLNADPRTETIPVVAISSSERLVAEARAAPVVEQAVVMPYDIDALQRAVAEALHHPPPAAVLPPRHYPPLESLAAAGKLLNAHSREIVLRAISRLQQIEPFKSRFAELSPGLVDNLPVILGAIVVGLQRGLTPEQVVAPPAIHDAIREHVNLRVSQGLTPASVIQEYQVLDDHMLDFLRDHIGEAQFSAVDAFLIARVIHDFTAEILRVAVNDFLARTKQPQAKGQARPSTTG
jgi:CheY-like chemotaxis protein